MEFADVLEKYRIESRSERDKGARFEELMARYFMTDPAYSSRIEHCWTWMGFHARGEFGGRDIGIDLVAKTRDGEYWAIQCKLYAEGHTVSKADVDTFLATSGKRFRDEGGRETGFSHCLIVATTDSWSANAREVSENRSVPVQFIGRSILEGAQVDWGLMEEGVHGREARTAKHELRPHQREAVDRALAHYSIRDRGTMVMACGTGKTFASLKIAEALAGGGGAEGTRARGAGASCSWPRPYPSSGRR